jgi:ABC-type amino acid transport system permease subunit
MSPSLAHLLTGFMPNFIAGMAVNFEIAGIALALGVAFGALLAFARLRRGVAAVAAGAVVGLMRAAPTFVVMFFLLNALPRGGGLSGVMIVALSLVPYAAAYVCDSGVDAFRQLQAGSPLAGLLILPNVARAFFVLVMSSSAGAAIGVPEGIAVILRQAEKMPSLGDMLVLFAIGVVCFGVPLQAGFAVIRWVQRRLGRVALRDPRVIPLSRPSPAGEPDAPRSTNPAPPASLTAISGAGPARSG